ncbi:hypothetical protein, partial [Aggregatibacter actinomycetemcomitans]|uniref:hypothetical protein n=1 Tax=Aggregatibacter actinomycetemcomitans TaxID=714 RepID=UPI00197B43F2
KHIGLQETEVEHENNTGGFEDQYQLQFQLTDENGRPHANKKFSIKLPSGEQEGITDENGFTSVYFNIGEGEAEIRLHVDEIECENWKWNL